MRTKLPLVFSPDLTELSFGGRSKRRHRADMPPEDYRGLNPLIYSHVNPYGRSELDLGGRMDFRNKVA